MQEVLVDLRYRGDLSPRHRRVLEPSIVAADYAAFRRRIADLEYWQARTNLPRLRDGRANTRLVARRDWLPEGGGSAACFPVLIGSTDRAGPESARAYFRHTEVEHRGGWFPLGASSVWHGGVHLHVAPGTAVRACWDGEVVAARLAADRAAASGALGSRNFILVHHAAGGAIRPFFSLYMHLGCEPAAGSSLARDLGGPAAAALRRGAVVRLERPVRGGDVLWTSGEFGPPGARAGLLHFEIFSERNLVPGWEAVEDPDEDAAMDSARVRALVDQDRGLFESDDVLTADELARFYATSPNAARLRRFACRFASEWALDLDVAIPRMRRSGFVFDATLRAVLRPYLFWDEAARAHVPLPASRCCWHVNPIAFLASGAFAPPSSARP